MWDISSTKTDDREAAGLLFVYLKSKTFQINVWRGLHILSLFNNGKECCVTPRQYWANAIYPHGCSGLAESLHSNTTCWLNLVFAAQNWLVLGPQCNHHCPDVFSFKNKSCLAYQQWAEACWYCFTQELHIGIQINRWVYFIEPLLAPPTDNHLSDICMCIKKCVYTCTLIKYGR